MREAPRIVVLDLNLPGGDALALLHQLRVCSPSATAVVYTQRVDAGTVQRAFRAGARAYVTKQDPLEDLLTAFRCAETGLRHASPRVSHAMLDCLAAGRMEVRGDGALELSDREREIFERIGRGSPPREIARLLRISPRTVETHCERMKAKLGVRSADELRRKATDFVHASFQA